MKFKLPLALLALVLPTSFLLAADVSGNWKAEIDTPIGLQKYVYTFKQTGTTVTGKANADIAGEKRETDLKDVKLDKDKITFVEMLKFQDNEIKVTYEGTIAGNEIKFHREVGEFAKEDLVAKRETPAAPAAPAAPAK